MSRSDSAIDVQILRLPHGADLALPAYQSDHAAGLDLMAAVPADTPVWLATLPADGPTGGFFNSRKPVLW